jgi:hypothetical protein
MATGSPGLRAGIRIGYSGKVAGDREGTSRVISHLQEHLLYVRRPKATFLRQAEVIKNVQLASSDFIALCGVRFGLESSHVANKARYDTWR